MGLFGRGESVLLALERMENPLHISSVLDATLMLCIFVLTAAAFYDGRTGHWVLQPEVLEVSNGFVLWYSVPVAQLRWLEWQHWK